MSQFWKDTATNIIDHVRDYDGRHDWCFVMTRDEAIRLVAASLERAASTRKPFNVGEI